MMRNTTWATRWTPVIRTVGVSLVLGVLLVVGAASVDAEEIRPAAPKAEPEAGPTDSTVGPVEGLRVHGHWTIEVRDPDGTLVERREFENALDGNTGNMTLTRILGRDWTVGNWQVWTMSQAASEVCEGTVGTPDIQCHIAEASDPSGAGVNNYFHTLVVSVPGSPPYSLNLSGYLIAQRDGSIQSVNTVVSTCGSAVAPAACVGAGVSSTWVTDTILVTPVSVLTGQQVQVNVVISFS